MFKRGWFGEPYKHSLASRGIKLEGQKIGSLEDIIEQDLNKARRPLSIQQISKRTRIAWATVNKHTKVLEKKGIIKIEKCGNRICCESIVSPSSI